MAATTYFKAVDSISDGSKGTQITSGGLGVILPYVTSQQRIIGITQLEKFYIQSDTNLTIFIGFTSLGLFQGRLIDSTGAAEVAGDVLGATARYGASEILANDANGCTIEHNAVTDLFRVGDYILVGDVVVEIATITANTADRVVTYLFTIPYVDLIGTNASSVLQKTLVANVGTPLWCEDIIAAGSPATQTYNTIPLVVVS